MKRTTLALPPLVLTLAGCGMLGGTTFPTAEVGECLNVEELNSQLGGAEQGEITELPTVDCAEEHDAEVFSAFDLEEGDYPGDEAVQTEAERCLTDFEDYVGTTYEESSLAVVQLYPLEQTWEQGDREILCIAYTLDGSTVTETFRDSAL